MRSRKPAVAVSAAWPIEPDSPRPVGPLTAAAKRRRPRVELVELEVAGASAAAGVLARRGGGFVRGGRAPPSRPPPARPRGPAAQAGETQTPARARAAAGGAG